MTDRMVLLPENPGVLRDTLTDINYHLDNTEEAMAIAGIINACQEIITKQNTRLNESHKFEAIVKRDIKEKQQRAGTYHEYDEDDY